MNKNKNLILSILGILSVMLITGGVTYAFFNYTKEGTTDNVITTDTITFLYTETDKVGNGIIIQNAFPKSDDLGKVSTKTNEYFDFKITSKTASITSIPYEITARKSSESDDIDKYIRVYLTKGETEEEVLLDNYDDLTQTSKVDENKYTEKTIYTSRVPSNQSNYEETFRLRMWLSDEARFDTMDMNNKIFTLTVNVYSNAKVVTQEEMEYESNTKINVLSINNTNLTAVSGEEYDYSVDLEKNTTSTNINIETENPSAKVTVEKIDSLAKSSNVKRLATTKNLELTEGFNYFKVTVTSENKIETSNYKLRIYVGDLYNSYSIGEEITLMDGSKWHVLEDSDKYSEDIVLLSDYNLNSDGTYNDECGRDVDGSYYCSTIAFDPDNTNTYDENDSNNIAYFIKNTYTPLVIKSLPGTSKVTLPTAQQIAIADDKIYNQSALELSSASWLITTNYWVKNTNTAHAYIVWNTGYRALIDNDKSNISGRSGARPTIATSKSNIVETIDSTTELSIGTAVEAVDGSKWHVLETSNSDSKYVTLLSDYNLNSDGTYNTECGRDINLTYKCSTMAFDTDVTNTYNETDSNNIGYFIKNTYEPLVTISLLQTINVTIPTASQIASADGQIINTQAITLANKWLSSTNYWTMNGDISNDGYVWIVSGLGSDLYLTKYMGDSTSCGARPVITTLKTNLLKK